MAKLLVFPSDPLQAYVLKGEVKERYFNPGNLFDEVHLISAGPKIENNALESAVGSANISIHYLRQNWEDPIGAANLMESYPEVSAIARKVKPDVVRAYNPLVQGFAAARVAQKLGRPLVVSLHTRYDLEQTYLPPSLKFEYRTFGHFYETLVLSRATPTVCAYRFLVPYAIKRGARHVSLIYNRVDTNRFTPPINPPTRDHLHIIAVSNLTGYKSPETLVRAMVGLNATMTMIGKGPMLGYLKGLSERLGVSSRVEFIETVPNNRLHEYYQKADVFATSILQGGVSIPTLEAMACGLPVVRARTMWEDVPELMEYGVGIIVENDPESFAKAFRVLESDPGMRRKLGQAARRLMEALSGQRMEDLEWKMYRNLLDHKPAA